MNHKHIFIMKSDRMESYSNSYPAVSVRVSTDAECLSEIIDSFKSYLLACGFAESLVNEYLDPEYESEDERIARGVEEAMEKLTSNDLTDEEEHA